MHHKIRTDRNKSNLSSSIFATTAELDLHGYRLEAALAALTRFLDEQQRQQKKKTNGASASGGAVATVITGMGQHSTSIGGPVLRHAVREYLERRRFRFDYARGCFRLRVDTGFLAYSRQSSYEDS